MILTHSPGPTRRRAGPAGHPRTQAGKRGEPGVEPGFDNGRRRNDNPRVSRQPTVSVMLKGWDIRPDHAKVVLYFVEVAFLFGCILLALFVLAAGITILQVAANPYVAAERGYVDRVIFPHETREMVLRGLRALRNKRASLPPKKHGNIPL